MTRSPADDSSSTPVRPQEANSESAEATDSDGRWWQRIRRSHFKRFFKFGLVGALGVFVNWGCFEVGYAVFRPIGEDPAIALAYLLGLVVSIFTNFVFNDLWTWADRVKGTIEDWFVRLGRYYVSASAAGAVQFAVSWITLHTIWRPLGLTLPAGVWSFGLFSIELDTIVLAPRLGLLTGVACGMIINFLASHLWAFQDAAETGQPE